MMAPSANRRRLNKRKGATIVLDYTISDPEANNAENYKLLVKL